MSNEIDSIDTSLVDNNRASALEVKFTGQALQDIKELKNSLGLETEQKVVNFAIALLMKAKKENVSIALMDSNNRISYSLDFIKWTVI